MASTTVTKAYFDSVFPELAALVPEAVVDALDPVAALYVEPGIFLDATQFAKALAIAHMTRLGASKGGGPLTAVGTGDVNESYAALSNEDSMRMTSYGLRLRDLGRMLNPGGLFVGGGRPDAQPYSGYQPTWPRPNF